MASPSLLTAVRTAVAGRRVRAAATGGLLLAAFAAFAGPDVRVLALFEGKALLEIAGTPRVLAAGAVSPEGVTLVSASSRGAVVEIDGLRRELALGGYARYGAAPTGREVRLVRDGRGAWHSIGQINGYGVEWLIDTGASAVALSGTDADRLGLPWRSVGRPIGVATAQGTKTGRRVVLDSVQIGDVRVTSVEAVVLDGNYPTGPLLGMSVLQRLGMRTEGDLLILQQDAP